jgi:hypothetical protein
MTAPVDVTARVSVRQRSSPFVRQQGPMRVMDRNGSRTETVKHRVGVPGI